MVETLLLPVRMVNEATYCRRLFWLERVTKQFVESHDTRDGTRVHARVDKPGGRLARRGVDGEEAPAVARSVTLSSEILGIVGKIDLVESVCEQAIPIDYKRGAAPWIPHGIPNACNFACKACCCVRRDTLAMRVCFIMRNHGGVSRSHSTMI